MINKFCMNKNIQEHCKRLSEILVDGHCNHKSTSNPQHYHHKVDNVIIFHEVNNPIQDIYITFLKVHYQLFKELHIDIKEIQLKNIRLKTYLHLKNLTISNPF